VRRITIDTNIWVSAFRFGGKPMQLVQLALDGEIVVALSQPIADETLRILRDKFGFSEKQLVSVLAVMRVCAIWVTPTKTLNVVADDADDNRIVERAVTAGSQAIISGDKHLLRLGNYAGIRVMNVREFLEG
jgi:uncharacterized protein